MHLSGAFCKTFLHFLHANLFAQVVLPAHDDGMRIVDCGLYAIASPLQHTHTSREIIQPSEKVLPLKCAKELERNQSVVVLLYSGTTRCGVLWLSLLKCCKSLDEIKKTLQNLSGKKKKKQRKQQALSFEKKGRRLNELTKLGTMY